MDDETKNTDPAEAGEDDAPAVETQADAALAEDAEDPVAALEAEVAELKDRLLRALAEADNTRRRAVKEREDASRYAVSKFAMDLLSVADNMARALSAVPADERDGSPLVKNLLAGVEGTARELEHVFERAGITRVASLDTNFDPNLHEAMMEVETNDVPPGMVVQVLQEGYMIHDRLLRPARVAVSKAPGTADPAVDQTV